ncbi:MAG: flagellin, partial [Petrotogales bacterium]
NRTVLKITDTTKKCVLLQNPNNFSSTVSANGVFGDSSVFASSATQFGIIVLQDGDNSLSSGSSVIMNKGDCVMITVNCTNCFSGLDARDDVWGQIIAEEGAPAVFSFRIPATLTKDIYRLY